MIELIWGIEYHHFETVKNLERQRDDFKNMLDLVIAEKEQLRKDNKELELQVDALTAKLKCQISCGCSYDRPDDICMAHLPIMEQLRKERDELAEEVKHLKQQLESWQYAAQEG